MRTSDKLILCLILFLLLAPSILKITERMCLKFEPPFPVPDFSVPDGTREGDSTFVTAPGDGVNWTRVTLGLRRSFKHGIIEDSSIFKDFNLEFLGNSCTSGPFFRPWSKKTLCWMTFDYLPKESDSLKYSISGISVDIWKYKTKPESPRMFRYENAVFNELESLPGVWDFWMYQSACCEWARGMWITTVRVSLQCCGNDSAKTVQLRDKIRDRLFVYYRSLK